ncbi:Transcriptional regulator, contains XRE-family HTH domain [Ruminococcaceae bacterium YRB3002]|nr:Transcriptional regulator, contains XRE-family HTH domain [Ruminococcaceae bacterium YRB3002]
MSGAHLQMLRESKHMTLVEASQKMYCGKSSLSRWEKGEKFPTRDQIRDIARAYDTDEDYIREILLMKDPLSKPETIPEDTIEAIIARITTVISISDEKLSSDIRRIDNLVTEKMHHYFVLGQLTRLFICLVILLAFFLFLR